MNQKEAKSAQVLGLLIDGQISQIEAANRMEVSPRRALRMLRRYRAMGLE